jgi:hypothetical protein
MKVIWNETGDSCVPIEAIVQFSIIASGTGTYSIQAVLSNNTNFLIQSNLTQANAIQFLENMIKDL